jgi:hypothetical protein
VPIVQIIVTLLVLALVWWLFSTYVLPRVVEPFKTIIIVILVLAVCLWLLAMVGLMPLTWRVPMR